MENILHRGVHHVIAIISFILLRIFLWKAPDGLRQVDIWLEVTSDVLLIIGRNFWQHCCATSQMVTALILMTMISSIRKTRTLTYD